jgi:hypothetical protein
MAHYDPFIDGLPIKNGGSFHGYVKWPDGTNENIVLFILFWLQIRYQQKIHRNQADSTYLSPPLGPMK